MAKNKELIEENFINETEVEGGWRIWMVLLAVAAGFIVMVFLAKSIVAITTSSINDQPFFQVTNREFSVFLWQHPELMRSNRREKTGYLSGFHSFPKAAPKPELADQWVQAPPEVLFQYHAWDRLLRSEEWDRKILGGEFSEFLDNDQQWLPEYWRGAPEGYRELVSKLPTLATVDVANQLPLEARQAFIGWKNYFYEGRRINTAIYHSDDVRRFIQKREHYSPNYWRGIYPDYLKTLSKDSVQRIPSNEIPSFLKVGLYNESQVHR